MQSIIAFFSFLALLGLVSCSPAVSTNPPANDAIPIKIGKVRHIQDREFISVSGTVVAPDAPVSVAFLVSGKVIQVAPREGDYVEEGDLLAAIDPIDYKLSLQAASAQVGQAKVAFNRSKDEYVRMKSLYVSKNISKNDFDKFKATWLSAEQQLNLAIAKQRLAQKQLNDASLYAPTTGYISKRSIEPGQTASPGNPVFEIVKLDPVEINVGIPETDIHFIDIAHASTVKIPALPSKTFEGKVRIINISADPNTRTYMTRIAVPNPDHMLRLGMVAEARIQGDRVFDLMTLPIETIIRDPQGATIVFVYYPEQHRAYAKRVETGAAYGQGIEIKSGLSGDEAIVFAGQEKLRDGALVSLAEESPLEGSQHLVERKGRP